MKKITSALLLFCSTIINAQTLYFPPITGTAWDTLSPASMGWCQDRIDTMYNYLEAHNTTGFIVLKDGKVVLEKYFGTFTADSLHVWNSAGKSFTALLTGIAQEEGLFSLDDTVSNIYMSGWTSCTTAQEKQITIHNLITMTSGLDDSPSGSGCDNDAVTSSCMQYLTAPGTRWAYHTGAYRQMEDVIAIAAGVTYNGFSNNKIENIIGMQGAWVNYNYYSRTRDMARFGLLALNKGIWATDTLLHDTAYFNAMINTSQPFNLSYGYLWWLNGKASYMAPGMQTVFTTPIMSNAPSDMFCALGKNDQKIYVVPSQNMVVVRNGGSAYGVASAFSPFDNELWGYIDSLDCLPLRINESVIKPVPAIIYPNPFSSKINLSGATGEEEYELLNAIGKSVWSGKYIEQTNFSELPAGLYFLKTKNARSLRVNRLVKQ